MSTGAGEQLGELEVGLLRCPAHLARVRELFSADMVRDTWGYDTVVIVSLLCI